MPRVQRSEPAELAREIAVVLATPRELDGRAPHRIVYVAEPPPRREDRREVVRIVVVTGTDAAPAAHGVGEASGVRAPQPAGPSAASNSQRRKPWTTARTRWSRGAS